MCQPDGRFFSGENLLSFCFAASALENRSMYMPYWLPNPIMIGALIVLSIGLVIHLWLVAREWQQSRRLSRNDR